MPSHRFSAVGMFGVEGRKARKLRDSMHAPKAAMVHGCHSVACFVSVFEWPVPGRASGASRPRVHKNKIPTSQISILLILYHRFCAEAKHNRLIGLVLHGKCNYREFLHTLGKLRTSQPLVCLRESGRWLTFKSRWKRGQREAGAGRAVGGAT